MNPFHKPGGGGSVWGPIAYDGKHLIFGTGNACQNDISTAQGAAALDLNGKMAWSFSAESNDAADDDTGGAVMVAGGVATFINKDGALYRLDATTGARLGATPLGAGNTLGGFSSPASDGSITLIGAGAIADRANDASRTSDFCALLWHDHRALVRPRSGYHSAWRAVDSAGNILWSQETALQNNSYAAVTGEVAFAGADSVLEALDVPSGRVLWSLPGANTFYAGAAVVPSGVYATDVAGNVYAVSLRANSAP